MKLAFIIFCISLFSGRNLVAAKVNFTKHSLLEKSQQYLVSDVIEDNCPDIFAHDLEVKNEKRFIQGAELFYSATIEGESQEENKKWKFKVLIKDLYEIEQRDVFLRSFYDC